MTEMNVVGERQVTLTPPIAAKDESVRPFRFTASEEALTDLRRRVQATRFADREIVGDQSQGVQLAALQALVRYWGTSYDWRKAEARLNALPQFMTTIDGTDIHFIHVRSRHPNALPLIITHGWPGSILEQVKVIGPLSDPTAYGGRAEDAFDVVIPSLPGYGFSGKPAVTGWNPARIAAAWDTLMKRLGYSRYVAQGGDWGAAVSDAMARQAPSGLLGVHLNFFTSAPPEVAQALAMNAPAPAGLSDEEKTDFDRRKLFYQAGQAYFIEMALRPQTIAASITDSPAGLAAWILDHDAASYGHLARLFVDNEPYGAVTRDDVLDNITLYWLTNTAASSGRLYWETGKARAAAAGKTFPPVTTPVAISVFPEELFGAPRTWVDRAYPNVLYYNKVEKGGHFAAWEQPELFTSEVRAAFKSLRTSAGTSSMPQ